ncbi:hypothetical protein ACFO4P_06500 [Epilithonimonas pallida]|uniref:AbiTii domain-containing protein n=1 Tax=Epilithonimonas pallida TaxID=373671 RepID=A0ABY1R806_9FLAO|nr:hypothetical protein [Epilithonimonas pallida]SMP96571.1 hypothetical protein SAMN05421679_109116 [Epilithonimonas pallida]
MDLINQIVNELVDDSLSLNSALLKTKVLASRIGNKELLSWTNSELSGYNSESTLPNYRKNVWNALKGTILNGNWKYPDHEIPTMGLDEDFEKSLRTSNFYESIQSLENLVKEKGTLGTPVRAEIMQMIENNWINMGNPYLSIISCNKIIPKANIVSIIACVRSKLLDFLLTIENEFGDDIEIKDLKRKNTEITNIMHQTIINSNGTGNSINTGNDNSLSNNTKIK